MSFLVDTNVVSELRKKSRCDAGVAQWFGQVADDEVFLSVLTLGEIRRGIERLARRDRKSAAALERWVSVLADDFAERILPVDRRVAEEWGRLNVPDALPVIDGLLAATARVHDLTFVTRNVADVERTGVPFLNPFST